MSWLKKAITKLHDFTGKVDPLGHALVDAAHKSSTTLVNETSKVLGDIGDSLGIGSALADKIAAASAKDKEDFARWAENTIASVALVYGGMAAANAIGGAGGAAAAGSEAAAGAGGAALEGAAAEAAWAAATEAAAAGAPSAAAIAAGDAAAVAAMGGQAVESGSWLKTAYDAYKGINAANSLLNKDDGGGGNMADTQEMGPGKTYYDDDGKAYHIVTGENGELDYAWGEDPADTRFQDYADEAQAGNTQYTDASGEVQDIPVGSTIDKLGNVLNKAGAFIGKVATTVGGSDLFTSGALGNIVTALLNNKQLEVNKDLLDKLQAQGTDALTALAAEIGNMSQPDLMALAKANPGMLPMLQQVKSEYHKIQLDPTAMNASKQSLTQLQDISQQGYGPIERAAAARVLGEMSNKNRGQQEAIKTDLASRGQYGSGQELQARMLAAQANANLASQEGLDIEAQAAKRALDAIRDKGRLGLDINQQEFNQEAEKAKAQDVINKFNTDMAGTVNKANLEQTNVQQQNAIKAAQAEYDNLINAKKAAAATAAQAAGNATNMYGANQKIVQTGIESRNQLIGSLLGGNRPAVSTTPVGTNTTTPSTTGGQTTGSSGSDTLNKIGNVVNTGKKAYDLWQGISSLWSDENVKTDKKELSDDDLCAVLDQLVPMSFKYNDSVIKKGAPKGHVVGVMAQQIEKTPAAGIIKLDSDGSRMVDGEKAMSLALASLGSLHKRLKEVEEK